MHPIRASARHSRAIHATSELLTKLRIDFVFLGSVSSSAWIGSAGAEGAIDVLALMNAPQKNQVAMMASNRGFRVDRDELLQTDELDLIPLHFTDVEGEVRVHVLLASNALYGRMLSACVEAAIDDRVVHVPRAEDLALLFLLSDDRAGLSRLTALSEFDQAGFDERLQSVGLASMSEGAQSR